MNFKKVFNGRALYVETNKIWVAKGMKFWAIDYSGNRVSRKYSIGNFIQKILSCNRMSRQLLREGIHHIVVLPNNNIIATTKKKTFVVDRNGKIINIFAGYRGNKPGTQGVCVTPDGSVFFGEYTLNPQRSHGSTLYRSIDGGLSFQAVYEFGKNEVRHIHFIKYDPFEKCLWMGTGDRDFECKLLRSDDNGDTWYVVGEGNQDWRAIGICFQKNYIIWGTDAGSVPDQNHIIRLDRQTKNIEIVANAEGPCHGCGSFKDGRVFISTGVEGGENEKDRFARLKYVDNTVIQNIFMLKKDLLPLILQYGVMRFPAGTENTNKVIFTAMGLIHGGETVFIQK